MYTDAKHSSPSFQSLIQQPSKDEVKLASKHKVVSEELSDKVDGEPLGEEPRRSLEKDLKFQGRAVKDLYFFGVVRWDSSPYQMLWTVRVQSDGI